jgi:hypothetical protein
MRRIAATPLLALMIITGHHARAAGIAAVITLSCDGTVRSGPRPDDVQRVSERRVVVNFAEHTVSVLCHIYRVGPDCEHRPCR